MVQICTPPEETPKGVIVKESGPKVVKFTLDEVDPNLNEIEHDTVHAIEVELLENTSLKIVTVQSVGRGLQDLPIHFWMSDKPYGMTIPRDWKNLNIISLLNDPTLIYMSEESVQTPPSDPSLIVVPAGKYYINLHNRHGKSSYYQVAVEVITH